MCVFGNIIINRTMYIYLCSEYHVLYGFFYHQCIQAAEPDDPQDAVVAKQYKENYEIYRKTANHWAQTYAGGKCVQESAKLNIFTEVVLCMYILYTPQLLP